MIVAQLKRSLSRLDLSRLVIGLLTISLVMQLAALLRPSLHPLYYLAHGMAMFALLVLLLWWLRLSITQRTRYITRVADLSEQVSLRLTAALFLLAMGSSAYLTITKPHNLLHPTATYISVMSGAIGLAVVGNLRLQASDQDRWLRKRSTWIVSGTLLVVAIPVQLLLWWTHGLPQGENWILHLDAEGYVYYAYQILGIVGPQPPTFLVRPPGYPLLVALLLAIVGETEIWILSLANAIMLALIPPMLGIIMCRFMRPLLALIVGLMSLGHEVSWSYLVLGAWRETAFLFVTVSTLVAISHYRDHHGYQRYSLLIMALLVSGRALMRLHGAALAVILSVGILSLRRVSLMSRAKQTIVTIAFTMVPLLFLYMYHGIVFGSPILSLESVTTILDNFPTEEGVDNPDTEEIRYVHSFLPEANYSDFFRVDMGYDLMFLRAYQQGIPYSELAKTANVAGWQIVGANLDNYVLYTSKNLLFHLFYPGFGKQFFNFHDVEYPPDWDEPRPKCLPDFLHVGLVTDTTCDDWEHYLGQMQRRPSWYGESTAKMIAAKDGMLNLLQSLFGKRNYFKGIIGILGSCVMLTQRKTRMMGFVLGSMLVAEIVPHAAFAPTQPRYTYVPQILSLMASSIGALVMVKLVSRWFHQDHNLSGSD